MKRFLWGLAALMPLSATLVTPSLARAQDAEGVEVVAEEPVDVNTGALSLSGGVDYTTTYFFRGYNQEDTGLIFQPWTTITASLVSTDDYTLNGYVGIWNSFHENKTGADGTGPSTWYEADLYGGLDMAIGKWTLGTIYTFYTYPNGAFNNVQEIGFKVAYDDTAFMEGKGFDFALKPFAGVYIETQDGNGSEDIYFEVGVAPSFALGNTDVTLSIPLLLGTSLDDYYLDEDGDNEFLGYGSIGLFASVPLGVSGNYGAWTLTGGVQYLQLFSDGLEAANDNGKDYELLGKVGVSFAY